MMQIAQATPDWAIFLAQSGVAGGVLLWFMLRTEVRLKGIENSNDRLTRATLLLVVSLNQANASAKDEARTMIRELDDARIKKSGPIGE